ncbi:lytic murein transglycosylase [Methylotenera sp.]|uniref:lytic murein transglycosylase n=1 Tax=Methylotenera sp. TaxID=2051956 RepID=UPI0027272236|nr:lytic murein transglycosylase [Methylotenera sp.]MDO9206537.1 lytic murein transglycosylase [Methylotenera sp.]MDP2231043.1 lytic murein transglycosylase [Methylotenera sp.]MDP3141308.1 lytic murein transglycosylase [Methylotenera sp.]
MKLLITFLVLLGCLLANTAFAREEFSLWLDALKQEAISVGITEQTATDTMSRVQLLPNIIKLDRSQPEFISPFLDYYQRRVDALKIKRGREMLANHAILLNQVEMQYGVPKEILVAFWGMETNYGRFQGNIDMLSALATLAYDGRRSSFFRNQLMDAMRMIDADHADAEELVGSWAGAFGNMQFMPTTFMTYAVDGDGDNKIDVVNSTADAFASAANYLSQVGWRKGEPAMIEVQLPANFDWQVAQFNLRKPVEEWVAMDVRPMQPTYLLSNNNPKARLVNVHRPKAKKNKKSLHQITYKKEAVKNLQSNQTASISSLKSTLPNVAGHAAIVLPQGWRGPAFMIFDNFDAVMDWNRSVNYALSVVQLANRINGKPPILGGQFAEVGALSFQQMIALQTELNKNGFDAGEPDGFPGLRTQEAVRAFQLSQRLPADGYASPNIFNYLKISQ